MRAPVGEMGGSEPRLSATQRKRAREMYEKKGADGKQRWTVAEAGNFFGVPRPTIYRALGRGDPDELPALLRFSRPASE